ncbi:unnamed protein product [Calypogeia fissa]
MTNDDGRRVGPIRRADSSGRLQTCGPVRGGKGAVRWSELQNSKVTRPDESRCGATDRATGYRRSKLEEEEEEEEKEEEEEGVLLLFRLVLYDDDGVEEHVSLEQSVVVCRDHALAARNLHHDDHHRVREGRPRRSAVKEGMKVVELLLRIRGRGDGRTDGREGRNGTGNEANE